MIEPLEARIAPATLTFINNKTATYKDVDGDLVTITITKGDLHAAVYTLMDTGAVGGAQMRSFDIGQDPTHFTGSNLTFSAKRQNGQGDARVNVGEILATGTDLGIVTVHGDLGRMLGGAGDATQSLASLVVGSLGYFGTTTGAANLDTSFVGKLGALKVTSDIVGADLTAGGTSGGIGNVTIGGSLLASPTGAKGRIVTNAGDIGFIKIGGDLKAGTEDESGRIISEGKIAGVTIGGSVYGGSDAFADSANQIGGKGDIGPVKIGGSIFGGAGPQSGGIQSLNGSIASVTIGGNLTAGTGAASGSILAAKNIGPVKIGGNFTASATNEAGKIQAPFNIASVFIGGSLIGSSGNYDINEGASSQIHTRNGTIGAVTIVGSVIGGNGTGSAGIHAGVSIPKVTIGGSLLAGMGTESAFIYTYQLGTVKIGGDMQGAVASRTGSISAGFLTSLTVSGSVLGSLIYGSVIGTVTIHGSLQGSDAAHPAAIVGVGGFDLPVAVKSVIVDGNVKFSNILAGYNVNLAVSSPDKQIGSIKVGGDWIASTAAAGVDPKAGGFADGDDVKSPTGADNTAIISRIGSITIGGQVSGTSGAGDHYGFVAQQIGAFKIDGQTIPLAAGTHNDVIQLGLTGDVTIREIAL